MKVMKVTIQLIKECFKNNAPEMRTIDNFHKLYTKCEDWARKKRLDLDTKDHNSMDIGGVDDNESTECPRDENFDDGYYDSDGNWWSWSGGYVNEVSNGKGRGKGSGPPLLSLRGPWPHR